MFHTHSSLNFADIRSAHERALTTSKSIRQPLAKGRACRWVEARGLLSLQAAGLFSKPPHTSLHIHSRLSVHHPLPKCEAKVRPAAVDMSASTAAQPQLEAARDPLIHQPNDAAHGLFLLAQAGGKQYAPTKRALPGIRWLRRL